MKRPLSEIKQGEETSWGYQVTLTEKEDLLKVKILCAFRPLSIQNHPVGDGGKDELHIPFCERHSYDTEMNEVLLRRWMMNQSWVPSEEEIMEETKIIPIPKGGRYLPAGFPHGLVSGKVLEISQQTDTTHRLSRAMGRETHIQEFFENWRRCHGHAMSQSSLGARWAIEGQSINHPDPHVEEFLIVDHEARTIVFSREPEIWWSGERGEERTLIPLRKKADPRREKIRDIEFVI